MKKSIFIEELEKLEKKYGKFDNTTELVSAVLDDDLYLDDLELDDLELDDLELDNDFSYLDIDDFLKLD